MFNKFIQTSAIAAALALGGAVAFAQTGSGSMQDTQQQVPQQQGQSQTGMQGQQQGALANPSQNLKSVKLSALDSSQIKEVQTQLKDLGFYKGAVDGVLGNVTRTALISYFNTEASLARQGKIADQSLTAFGFNQSDIEKVRGNEQNSGSNVRQNTQGQDQNKGLQPQQPTNGMRQQQQQTQPQNPQNQP